MGDRPVPVIAAGAIVAPEQVWSAWGGDPLVLPVLLLVGWGYWRGVRRIWAQTGRGQVVTGWHLAAWGGGMAALVLALASPLDALAGTLLTGHMSQHVLLTLVAAPLLAASAAVLPLRVGLPGGLRRRAGRLHKTSQLVRRHTHTTGWPFAAAALHSAVMCLWHLPGVYQAALRNDLLHTAEHVSMLGSALLLWWAVLATGRRSEFGYGTGIAVVFFVALVHGALGALITFAPTALYPSYAAGTAAWGVSPLGDQQLAGVVMWAPGKLVHGGAVVLLAVAWLRAVEARTQAREQARAGGSSRG